MQAWPSPQFPRLDPAPDLGPVRIHDTLSDAVQTVGPSDGTARLYVCGITPYDATHMGHAYTYVVFDLLNRAWRDAGLGVNFVQNVTDVDDPLLERARENDEDWQALAERETELFRTDMRALNVIAPDEYIGAVESIPLVIDILKKFPADRLYQLDDPQYPDWYFSVEGVPGFGELSGLGEDEARALFAERGGDPERHGKRHPLDCLVWQQQRPDEPAWRSPFGFGRPGWHIECTAIALRYLGENFDVQGGGTDLIFPHHEMSAAEGIAVTGVPFARHYAHTSLVGLDGEKMSKSKGNLVLVSKLRESGADPMAIRLTLLGHHYRGVWSWTDEDFQLGQRRLERWREAVDAERGARADRAVVELRSAMRNNLDAPAALAVVDDWVDASRNTDSAELDAEAPGQMARAVDALLGIRL